MPSQLLAPRQTGVCPLAHISGAWPHAQSHPTMPCTTSSVSNHCSIHCSQCVILLHPCMSIPHALVLGHALVPTSKGEIMPYVVERHKGISCMSRHPCISCVLPHIGTNLEACLGAMLKVILLCHALPMGVLSRCSTHWSQWVILLPCMSIPHALVLGHALVLTSKGEIMPYVITDTEAFHACPGGHA